MKRSREDDDDDDDGDFEAFTTQEEEEPMMGRRTGDVDLTNYRRGLYLLKLPNHLLDTLKKGTNAKLRLPTAADDETGEATGELVLERKSDGPGHHQRKYDIQIKPEPADVVIFSSDNADDEGKIQMEGVVSHQCVARPKLDRSFKDRLRQNVKSAMQPKRKMAILDDDEYRKAEHHVYKPQTAQQTRDAKYQREQRRRHVEEPEHEWRDKNMTRLFELFAKQPHWSLADLANVMDEPQQRLKSLLNEACDYNRSGPHRNMYELKDEYKTVDQRKEKQEEIQARQEARQAEFERQKRLREEREAYEREHAN